MKSAMINRTHIEGLLYQHDLELKVTGDNSKNPGTEFISGNIEIATDDAGVNIVPVHFTYVTATTSKGKANASFSTLSDIINGKLGTVMKDGADKAVKLRIDSAIGLNEFYSDRNGKEELVSVKRNEGGFIHVVNAINEDEKTRNTFEVDMIITNVTHVDANEERQTPEKSIVRGAIFNFRNDLMPIELSVLNPNAMNYFEGLDASAKNPVFTKVKGRQVSETITRTIEEESAFGEASVREVKSTRKDFVITWAMKEPYLWDDESTITASELKDCMAKRETDLAAMKARSDEYKASKGGAAKATPAAGGFDF
ncbi:MAG: hypothetical protein J6Q39_04985 [Bacteroidales bacterium]|nr:hypothetical protein [Bacteroidales bacterium]